MAGYDEGTIYAQIRVQLDNLQNDLNKVHTMFLKNAGDIDHSVGRTKQDTIRQFDELGKGGIESIVKMGEGIKKAINAIPIVALITAIAGTAKKLASTISDYLNKTSKAYFAQQVELRTLETIVKQTGASAWISAGQLETMARELGRISGVATTEVMAMQSRLLTYTNIVGENFKRTQKIALDMAAVMKMDVTSAAETLGKALDSPIEGLNALTRQGFRFKEDLKEQIRLLISQGNVSKAQALILSQIENVYAGVAEATNVAADSSARLKNAQTELYAELGRQTSRWVEWTKGVRAAIAESRAFSLRQKRLADESEANSKKVNILETSIKELKETLRTTTGDEFIEITKKIEKLEEQLAVINGSADNINTEFELMENRYNMIQREIENGIRNVRDFWEASLPPREIEEKVNEYVEGMHDIYRADLMRYAGARLARQASVDNQTATAAEIELNRKIAAELLEIKNLTDQATAATERSADMTRQASLAVTQGRITNDEYEQRILTAYTEEANALEVIKKKIDDVTVTTMDGLRARTLGQRNVEEAGNSAVKAEIKQQNLIIRTGAVLEARRKIEENIAAIREAGVDKAILSGEEIIAAEQKVTLEKLRQSEQYKNITKGLVEGTAEFIAQRREQLELEKSVSDEIAARLSTEHEAQEMLRRGKKDLELLEVQRLNELKQVKDMERLIGKEKLEAEDAFRFATEETKQKLLEQYEALEKAKDALALIRMMEEYSVKLQMVKKDTTALTEAQRQQALTQAALLDDGSEGFKELIEQINEYYDLLGKGGKNVVKDFIKNTTEWVDQAASLFSAIMSAVLAFAKRDMEEQKKLLDKDWKDRQKVLDDELQDRLYRMGLIEAATKEQYEEDLKRAIESGDQHRMLAADTALQRYQVEKEYADKKEKLDEEMADKKADLDYQMAMAEWRINLANAFVAAAQAQLSIWSKIDLFTSVPTIALAGFAAGISAAQIAAIHANQPVKKMAGGGILPGNVMGGDRSLFLGNPEEMVLNKEGQQNLFNKIMRNDMDSDMSIEIPVYLDSMIIARAVVDRINNRQVLIKQGGIIK